MNINPETAERIVLSEAAFNKLEEIDNAAASSEPSPKLVELMKAHKARTAGQRMNVKPAADDGPSM